MLSLPSGAMRCSCVVAVLVVVQGNEPDAQPSALAEVWNTDDDCCSAEGPSAGDSGCTLSALQTGAKKVVAPRNRHKYPPKDCGPCGENIGDTRQVAGCAAKCSSCGGYLDYRPGDADGLGYTYCAGKYGITTSKPSEGELVGHFTVDKAGTYDVYVKQQN
mmetsp:Transcript_115796/g.322501  ORF Transcript_115796/g.322501 Transcript_115796/m.322501 type:complete len:161 (+) Transcript_115796:52-534(+)